MVPSQLTSKKAWPLANEQKQDRTVKASKSAFIRRLMPRTTGGLLTAIMLSVLIPVLILQTAIYLFWFRTRAQAETVANTEFALSAATSFQRYIREIRRQGVVIGNAINEVQPFSPEHASYLLKLLKAQYPTVLRFSLVDEEGRIVASSDARVIGLSVADRSYVREINSGREWAITDLKDGPLPNMISFSIASKVQFRGGRNEMIVAVIDPDALGDIVLPRRRPDRGFFTLFDREGNLVYFGGSAKIEHSNWRDADPVLREALQGKEASGTIPYPVDKKSHIVARVPVENIGWVSGASRPVQAAMEPIYRNLAWIAALNGIMVIISLAGAFGLSRFLIARLNWLRDFAADIAGGDFSSKPKITNPVELAELEKSFAVMADQVKTRQESLQTAVSDLTRSNQELEQFAYVASHDLQEPLRVITGFVQLIASRYQGRLDSDADRYIGFITDAVSRQQELIRDLLSFSRLGRQAINMNPVNANSAFKAACQNIHRMIQDSGATVTYDELPTVRVDGGQLVQLFQNLISNGLKFRGTEPPKIHVSAQPEDEKWVFTVKDNGIGIEPGYRDQIFVMFKRLHTRKEYPGTGIGLAICKKIVERHGGRIWVDSEPGEGSTFRFTLNAAGETQNDV